jgi:hypothetical protein
MKRILLVVLLVVVASAVYGAPTIVRARDFWVNWSTGAVIGPANGAPPLEAIGLIHNSGSPTDAYGAVALRMVTVEMIGLPLPPPTGNIGGPIKKVLRSYFVAVPVPPSFVATPGQPAPPGAPSLVATTTGATYWPFKKVRRAGGIDGAASAFGYGWYWGK